MDPDGSRRSLTPNSDILDIDGLVYSRAATPDYTRGWNITDPDGNAITVNGNGWTDSINRQIPGTWGSTGEDDPYPGVATSDLSHCDSGTGTARIWSVPGKSQPYYFCFKSYSGTTAFHVTSFGSYLFDQNAEFLNGSSVHGTWQERIFDLTPSVGCMFDSMIVGPLQAGSVDAYDFWIGDMRIRSADGRETPIYAGWWQANVGAYQTPSQRPKCGGGVRRDCGSRLLSFRRFGIGYRIWLGVRILWFNSFSICHQVLRHRPLGHRISGI